jgi:hypothetical protein
MKISGCLNRLARSGLAKRLVSTFRVSVVLAVAVLAQPFAACGEENVWNAYQDFYLDPTATGWQGATAPSKSGAAWGYYAANVNGYGGYPRTIGAYFASGAFSADKPEQNLCAYSPSHQPLGPGNAVVGTTKWDDTKGTGFPRYADDKGWGSSLGRYDLPWFPAAPGYAVEGPQPRENRIWMQAGYLQNTGEDGKPPAEGICPVLVWKAPMAGTFAITGSFLIGLNGEPKTNGASIAIVDSKGDALMKRTGVEQGKSYEFRYSKQYEEGDVVQFQVGTDYKTGTPVGLNVTISTATETAP